MLGKDPGTFCMENNMWLPTELWTYLESTVDLSHPGIEQVNFCLMEINWASVQRSSCSWPFTPVLVSTCQLACAAVAKWAGIANVRQGR